METRKRKPRNLLAVLLLSLFFIASAGVNYLLLKDYVRPNVAAASEMPAGDNYNSHTNQSFVQIINDRQGRVPILMYHNIVTPRLERKFANIAAGARRYYVTSAQFRDELEKLYENGFANISLDEYLSLMTGAKTTIDRLPPNKKLYILTFDDATFGQFDFSGRDANGKPVVDTNCAVGIMLDFARRHPDFKLNAAFCVDFENTPFQEAGEVQEKLNLLLDYGFEIVNHTATHKYLADYVVSRPEVVNYEIGRAMELFESYLGYRASTIDKICYPGGKDSVKLQDFVHEIKYNGRTYKFVMALDAEGYQAVNPASPAFNAYDVARIELNDRTFDSDVLYARGLLRTPDLEKVPLQSRGGGAYDIYGLLSNGIFENVQ